MTQIKPGHTLFTHGTLMGGELSIDAASGGAGPGALHLSGNAANNGIITLQGGTY